MANILLTDPVYISVLDVKESTSVPELSAATDDEVTRYINEAQTIIDSDIVSYGYKTVSTQENIFPANWETTIPSDISIATLYVVEALFLQWPPTSWSTQWQIIEETVDDHRIKYSTGSEWDYDMIPEKAQNILANYKNMFVKQVNYSPSNTSNA